jgi:antitoxin component of MazEF toxin-antitoxin module
MKKKLFKSGNAWVLLLQKAILELLDIDPENDEVELVVNDKVLTVKKVEK